MFLLAIEFLDELVFGLQDAAWPVIRNELKLDYLQIGLLLSVPGIIANLIEPVIFVLGDVWRRRPIIIIGGIAFTVALALVALARDFEWLMMAFILFNPASGAFVSLSQATLMDAQPARREQNMARWNLAGSAGVFLGPLVLGALLAAGLTWRHGYWGLAATSLMVLVATLRPRPGSAVVTAYAAESRTLAGAFRSLPAVLRDREVVRWLVLLELGDLMLDVLYGFLALYFVDVAGTSPGTAALAVAIWSGVGLLGDFLLLPLLERVRGLTYLRFSVVAELVLFPLFLLAPALPWKLALLALLGLFNSGWYAILQARLYESAPTRSGSVLALNNIAGLFGRLLPLAVGWAANEFGLGAAIWLLLVGPVGLLVGLPRAIRPMAGGT